MKKTITTVLYTLVSVYGLITLYGLYCSEPHHIVRDKRIKALFKESDSLINVEKDLVSRLTDPRLNLQWMSTFSNELATVRIKKRYVDMRTDSILNEIADEFKIPRKK